MSETIQIIPEHLLHQPLVPRFVLRTEAYIDPVTSEPQPHAAIDALHEAREAWEEMRALDPDYFIGAVVFGSSVKGRFTNNHRFDGHASDIDMMILADPECGGKRQQFTAPNVQEILRSRVVEKRVFSGLGGQPPHIINVNPDHFIPVVEISKKIIDRVILNMVKHYIRKEGEEFPAYKVGLKALYVPFMMRLGSGKLQEYRKHILDRIEGYAADCEPDQLWRAIAVEIYYFEEAKTRSDQKRANIYLPKTIAEARHYFKLADAGLGE